MVKVSRSIGSPKTSAKRRSKVKATPSKKKKDSFEDVKRGALRVKAGSKTALANLRKKRALDAYLNKEPKPVRNFARRAIKKGTPARKAVDQGRILHKADRINDQGKLKKSGGSRLSLASLKRFIRR